MGLVAGIACLFVIIAAFSLASGRTLSRGHRGWVYREEEPGAYWSVVDAYGVAAVGFFFLARLFHARGAP